MNYYMSHGEWLDKMQSRGEFFGFPQCCIDDFLSRERAPNESRKFCGTGYIPCPKCNELSEEEIVTNINKRRKCKEPFPEGGHLSEGFE